MPVHRGNIAIPTVVVLSIAAAWGQSRLRPDEKDWQAAAGGKMAFEVASIHLDRGPFRPPKFPLDNGDAYMPGDRFSADFPLLTYIQFAYKIRFSSQQRESMFSRGRLPKWIYADRYAIEAKATTRATKDQMRLMMQSLLAERFHLAAHLETQETAVLALRLVRPGILGPKLRPHNQGPPCEAPVPAVSPHRKPSSIFPERCYVQELEGKGQELRAGSRNTTMDQLAEVLPALGRLDRPVVDKTGITGRIDYEIDFTRIGDLNPTAAAALSLDSGATFLEAVHEQLGLKLAPVKAPLQVLVIDHVERPSEN